MLSSADILKIADPSRGLVSWRGLNRQPTRRRLPVRLILCLLAVTMLLVKTVAVQAQQQFIDREYQIKAAYLYNFAKYVRWPEDTDRSCIRTEDVFVIGIAGSDPFRGALQQIAKRHTIQGRSIRVVIVVQATDTCNCDLLFVPRHVASTFDMSPLKTDENKPILIVGESEGFAKTGGMVNFYIDNNRVRFEINPEAAAHAGLQISAKLLQLGKLVHTVTTSNERSAQGERGNGIGARFWRR